MHVHRIASLEGVLKVQFIPSGDVITLFVPEYATAQNNPISAAQVTPHQPLAAGEVLFVQLRPSVDVFICPVWATATNILNSGDQHTPLH
jgi:hypothetical protein